MAFSNTQAMKERLERIKANVARPSEQHPPPTYEQSMEEIDYENDDAQAMLDDHCVEPHVIQVDASTSVNGHGNIVHADIIAATGARATAAICSLLKEQDQEHSMSAMPPSTSTNPSAQGTHLRSRPVRIGLNLSVRIAGARNVVGCTSNPRAPQRAHSAPTSPTFDAVPPHVSHESRSQPRSQQAARGVDAVADAATNVAVAQPSSRSSEASFDAFGYPRLSLPHSASTSSKRKAHSDDMDTDVEVVTGRKKLRLTEDPEEGLGGAE